jgi:hypothetical protein
MRAMNRRNFLKSVLASGATACASGAMWGGCTGSLTRAELIGPDGNVSSSAHLDERGRSILHYASLAPSGHNTQPWSVHILEPDRWIVGIDPQRRLPAVDPHNREAMLSIGAFTENLVLAAGVMGLEARVRILASAPWAEEVLEVTFEKGKPSSYPLERLIQRMTVKKGYLPDEIKAEDIRYLSQALPGRLFYFPRGSSHGQCIQEGAIENFRIQAERDDAQRETVQWLRLSNRDARRYRDGLTVAGMEITGLKGWFVRNFVAPEAFLKPGFREQSIAHTAKLAQQGGGWLIITSQGHTVNDWIDSGRLFERMALLARERRIALQPMTQYLEETHGKEKIAAHHDAHVIPQFVLRVGYLKHYPQPASLRRPVSWFVR